MSSRGRTGTATKKKFGKNLNKLTEKPAPPITAPAKGSSRNGLLLLSTKRSSSNAASSSGLLATKTGASPTKETARPLGVTTESYTSAHDALLGAVIGASRTADPQQPPDAWGVASDKPQTEEMPDGSVVPNTGADLAMPDEETTTGGGAEQGEYMSKLAHDRAEQRRLEEETRMNEQRMRAEQRLRELEEKMAVEQERAAPTSVLSRPVESEPVSEPVLRAEDGASATEYKRSPARPRTLYDPNRTYDSVAGANQIVQAPQETESRFGPISQKAIAAEPINPPEPQEPHFQMVNLSKHVDRDRGERGAAVGPRMLFDPKSGSMVAVKEREKGAVKNGGKTKGRNGRAAVSDRGDGAVDSGKSRDAELKPKKLKTRNDDVQRGPSGSTREKKGRGNSKRASSEARLPRTCGVLYTREKKGNFVCADKCDGDHGYGCHSVPGGRVRNPNAYKQLMDDQQLYEPGTGNGHGIGSYDFEGSSPLDKGPGSPKALAPAVDWIKPNEKIELVTGAMESPTLRATAGAWAPSGVALTAAAAAQQHLATANDAPTAMSRNIKGEEGDELNGTDLPSFIGLGFDPAENMDSVMRSPTSERTKMDSDGLAALALDAPRSEDPTARNIFAFGASSAWGESGANSTQDMNGWSTLDSGRNTACGGNQEAQGASFLSLSTSTSPWGTGGLSGLGGPAIPQVHSSDSGAPAGDG